MRRELIAFLLSISPFLGTAQAADAAKGKQIYDTVCAACHGPQGAGDGPAAVAMPAEQKPRNFQKPSFKYATNDAKFKDLLHKGGTAAGLSPLMPAQPNFSDADIDNVIAYVRTLKK